MTRHTEPRSDELPRYGIGVGAAEAVPRRIVLALAMAWTALGCAGGARALVREESRLVNGTELFVKRIGRGEPVLVVHGGPSLDHGYLLPHLAPLSSGFALVLFDQRLSGRSSGTVDSASVRVATFVEDIEALRASLGLGRIHLIGHSWGGLLALRYAIAHGNRLRSLTLLSPMPPSAVLWQEEEKALAALSTQADSVDMARLRESVEFQRREPSAIARMLALSFRHQFFDRTKVDLLRLGVPPDHSNRARQFAFLIDDLVSYDHVRELAAIDLPTLIIYGEQEPAARISGPVLKHGIAGAK
jgi:proline iminopeptidase